jgi:hypothetical protein
MVYFQTKNTNLGKFLRALDGKMFIYCMAIWNTLRTFAIFYDHLEYFSDIWDFYDHLVHFVFIWDIFSGFGIMYQ